LTLSKTAAYPNAADTDVVAPISGAIEVRGSLLFSGNFYVDAYVRITGSDGTEVDLTPLTIAKDFPSKVTAGQYIGIAGPHQAEDDKSPANFLVSVKRKGVYVDALAFLAATKAGRRGPGDSQVEQPLDAASQATSGGMGAILLLAGAAFFFLKGKRR
jgi:hypothetical protein